MPRPGRQSGRLGRNGRGTTGPGRKKECQTAPGSPGRAGKGTADGKKTVPPGPAKLAARGTASETPFSWRQSRNYLRGDGVLENAGGKSPAGRKNKRGQGPKNQTGSNGGPPRGIFGGNPKTGRNVLTKRPGVKNKSLIYKYLLRVPGHASGLARREGRIFRGSARIGTTAFARSGRPAHPAGPAHWSLDCCPLCGVPAVPLMRQPVFSVSPSHNPTQR